jgi:hypothetical protein
MVFFMVFIARSKAADIDHEMKIEFGMVSGSLN